MALATFGVDHDTIERRFYNYSFDDLSGPISGWVLQAAASLETELQQLGYSSAEASALGSGHQLYVLCQLYIECHAAANVARAITLENPALAQEYDRQAKRARDQIADQFEGVLGDAHDPDEHLGVFRVLRAVRRRSSTPARRRGRWRRLWRRDKL